ncbi:9813_t:CDS:2, partial [Acaulospora morrowiae]
EEDLEEEDLDEEDCLTSEDEEMYYYDGDHERKDYHIDDEGDFSMNYGYMKKWLHMEDDELLLPYGESDQEQNYISSDLEEDMRKEEEECLRKGKPSLFIDVDSIEHNDCTQRIIDQYIEMVYENWKSEKLPKLEEKKWKHWVKLLPPRKH